MAANSPSSPPYIDCTAKGIVYIPPRGSLCHTTRIPGRLYAGTIAHVSVSNPVPVGSTIYGQTIDIIDGYVSIISMVTAPRVCIL